MRRAKISSIADNLIDRRKRNGMLEHEAITLYDTRERIVLAEINQGLPESEHGSTGNVGQNKEQLEEKDDSKNEKEKKRPSIAYDG